jgi:hypothetical protein
MRSVRVPTYKDPINWAIAIKVFRVAKEEEEEVLLPVSRDST